MNTSIFLTTRYSSTRLPGKSLLKINGQTVTDILIERLKKTGLPIIICCPDTIDDVLHMKPIAEKHSIGFFAGEPTNIIKRHYDCAIENNVDTIVNVDGDDILTCPEVINAVNYELSSHPQANVVKTAWLPLGLNILGYRAKILKDIDYNSDTNWGAQIKNTYTSTLRFDYDTPYFLSMDYIEDFEVVKNVLENCKRNLLVGGICDYFKKHPEIAWINYKRNKERFERWGYKCLN